MSASTIPQSAIRMNLSEATVMPPVLAQRSSSLPRSGRLGQTQCDSPCHSVVSSASLMCDRRSYTVHRCTRETGRAPVDRAISMHKNRCTHPCQIATCKACAMSRHSISKEPARWLLLRMDMMKRSKS